MNTGGYPHLGSWGPRARIDCQAISHNLAWLRRRVASAGTQPVPRIWAVIKANAYGHGLAHAVAALQNADGLAVSDPHDAYHVRSLGWGGPLLLLSACGLEVDTLADPALGELHVVIDDEYQLALLEASRLTGRGLHVWLRYAGRLGSHGLGDPAYGRAYARLQSLQRAGILAQVGHLHHYASAEDPDALRQERSEFAALVGHHPGPCNTGNSAALCGAAPEALDDRTQWLRCGLLLFGASALPGVTGADLGLRPAMSLQAPLLAVRHIRAGQTVGYGESFRTQRDTYIGVVGVGYSHGIPRSLWQHGRLLAGHGGRPVPAAGRVAMDTLTVDLGPDAPEQPGDVMTLWGQTAGGAHLPVETVAAACSTIAAELLTSLTARVPLQADS